MVANTSVTLTVVGATPFWTGGSSSDSDWSDAANWGGIGLTADAPLIFNGTARLNNTNDTTAATIYSNIVFNPGAGAFTLNGNPVTLGGNITNNSVNAQTINLGLNFSNSFTFDGVSSPLIFGGGLTNRAGTNGATTLNLAQRASWRTSSTAPSALAAPISCCLTTPPRFGL